MRLYSWWAAVLLLSATGVCVAGNSIVPTTTLAAQTGNNTSAANSFSSQSNGNSGAGNVSKVDVHSLLYGGSTTKVYAHMLLWFGGSNHMNVGYSSTDTTEIHNQITDMISRGIDGVIIDWYGPNNSIDDATKSVMAEAEKHAGFTFAIMVDQGAIEWDSCSGCSPQQALISQLQYIEQTYFPSPAYMTWQGKPVITNFNIDLSYSINWDSVNAALSTAPAFLFQNNSGFTHVLTDGSYSWVMPTTSDYGMSYLTSFYDAGMPLSNQQTVGASYKGFNDTLASWGSNRIMGQQCGQTWLGTFSEVNSLYGSAAQLPALQLVTWNDYEEATEIESGINNCFSVSASVSSNSLKWTIKGNENTVDHYVPYISLDGQNLMPLEQTYPGTYSLDLCNYSLPNGNYTSYVQAVGKPSITNQMSGGVEFTLSCAATTPNPPSTPQQPNKPNTPTQPTLTLTASPSTLSLASGASGTVNVTVKPSSGSVASSIALTCSGLPQGLSCSFSPSSVTPGASGGTSVLTIASAPIATASNSEKRHFLLALWLFGYGFFGWVAIGRVQRRRFRTVVGACILAVMIVAITSCGGQAVSPANTNLSKPVSYVVNVVANFGSVQLSTAVKVTVP